MRIPDSSLGANTTDRVCKALKVGRSSEWRKRDGLYSGSEKSGKNLGRGQGLVRVKQEGHGNVHIR